MSRVDSSSYSLTHRVLDAIGVPRREIATSVWLLQMRWVAVIGQLLTISVAGFLFGDELPVQPLFVLVGFTAATNIVYAVWLRDEQATATLSPSSSTSPELLVPSVAGTGYSAGVKLRVAEILMAIDLITLTAMLHFSGGIDNPFSAFYFVNLAVAGVILQSHIAWGMTVLAITGFATLMFSYVPLSVLEPLGDSHDNSTRHWGSFLAFAASASVVTYFVISTSQELLRREQQLRRVQSEQERTRQLDSLSTLAAGAAHELATPMSTVLLIARELQHHLDGVDVPGTVHNDLQLIESELRHCRAILDRMRAAVGESAGESWQQTTLGELIDIVLEGIREPQRVEISTETEAFEDSDLWLPCEAVAQAIRNLIHNGLDASPSDSQVIVAATVDENRVYFKVIDEGEGMSDNVLNRLGQPFFTTKEPGRGMGLGLFLTRNVIQRLGGQLRFETRGGAGTTALVELPRSATNRSTNGKSLGHAE